MFCKLGYDGSESSENAFEKAIELAQKFQSKIYVLTVGRIPQYIQTIDEVEEAKTQAKKFYSKILQKAEEEMKLKNLDYEILLEYCSWNEKTFFFKKDTWSNCSVLDVR